jgi:hypothetical protein
MKKLFEKQYTFNITAIINISFVMIIIENNGSLFNNQKLN